MLLLQILYLKDLAEHHLQMLLYRLFLLRMNMYFFVGIHLKYKYLYKLATSQNKIINDEATLFIENNIKIKFIKGENKNNKIT